MELNNQAAIRISDQSLTRKLGRAQVFTSHDFLTQLSQNLARREELQKKWLEGVDCSVLMPGQQWQKGKIRLSIDFVSDDETEGGQKSPLDDIRQNSGN